MSSTATALKEQGNTKFQAKQYVEAVELYTQAIALDSKNAVLYSNRSVSQLSLGKAQEALADAQQACELRPDWEKGHFRRAAALEAQGQLQQALSAYQHALLLKPMSEEIIKKVRELKQQTVKPSHMPQSGSHANSSGPHSTRAGAAGAAGAGPAGWAVGLSPDQQAEWLVDCYRIRLDDEYESKAMSGQVHIKTRGLYDINYHFVEEAKSMIAEDFLIFCSLAMKCGVIPLAWDWAEFLSTAARLLPIIFERKDCQQKWGYEFVMYSPLMGRSMRHTAAVVYGTSVLGGFPTQGDGGREYSIVRNKVLRRWQQLVHGDGSQLFGKVGGLELWMKLHSEMVIKFPSSDFLLQGAVRMTRRQMGLGF